MNSPHEPHVTSAQMDCELRLVQEYFEVPSDYCLKTCIHYHECSDSCEAIEEGDASMCPALPELIEQALHEMEDCSKSIY